VREARVAFRAAEALGHDFHALSARQWLCAMLLGDLAAAWGIGDAVLRRRRAEGLSCAGEPLHRQWLWDGSRLDGRDVLVRCHHGLGDVIQMARLLPPLHERAARVRLQAPTALLGLLAGAAGVDELHDLASPMPAHETAIELMELPHALRLSWESLPRRVPYLRPAGPPYRARDGRLRVGLAWAAGAWKPERSLALADLLPLAIPGIDLVCLQRGPALAELAPTPFPFAEADDDEDILRTAAAMQGLDLVISVDTMVAHLAGALGRPVWVLLHHAADWRWQIGRTDSPWYPTMRLFRQTAPGAWGPVVEAVERELRAMPGLKQAEGR
jgi:hypothetical protein